VFYSIFFFKNIQDKWCKEKDNKGKKLGELIMDGNMTLNVFRAILSYRGKGPHKIMCFLFFYSFVFFMIIHFLSTYRNGSYELSEEFWIIAGVCGVVIEILNQITYYWGRKNRKKASIVKGIFFWVTFTIGCIVYISLLSSLEIKPSWKWHEQVGHFIIYLCLSWVMPVYSFSTDIRFLFLVGKYKNN
jgi:hypothetical protein